VNEPDPAPASKAPETVTNPGDAAAAPGIAHNAGTSNKKGKAQGGEKIKKGNTNGHGNGTQKRARP